jgi:hypothetical protein
MESQKSAPVKLIALALPVLSSLRRCQKWWNDRPSKCWTLLVQWKSFTSEKMWRIFLCGTFLTVFCSLQVSLKAENCLTWQAVQKDCCRQFVLFLQMAKQNYKNFSKSFSSQFSMINVSVISLSVPCRVSGGSAPLRPSLHRHNRACQHLSGHTSPDMSFWTSAYTKTSFPQLAYCRWCERYMMYRSDDDDWDEFVLLGSNCCSKLVLYCTSLVLLFQYLPVKFSFSHFISMIWLAIYVMVLFVSLVPKRQHISNSFYQISFVHCTNSHIIL